MYIHDRAVGRSLAEATDADGKIKVRAKCVGDVTAKYLYGLYVGYDGYRSQIHTAPLRGPGSATATYLTYAPLYKMGVAMETATSDDTIWFQVGGYASVTLATATTIAAGAYLEVTGSAIVAGVATSSVPAINTFATVYSATTSTSAELMLWNKFITVYI